MLGTDLHDPEKVEEFTWGMELLPVEAVFGGQKIRTRSPETEFFSVVRNQFGWYSCLSGVGSKGQEIYMG